MAEFCKQCSEELFDADFGELAGLVRKGWTAALVECEGCGATAVNSAGECVTDCLKHHVPGDHHE